jgi:urea carboxylase
VAEQFRSGSVIAMFNKVLVANRGEIALRVVRTLSRMGVGSVAVYSDADRFAPAVLAADEAVRIGPAPATQSYLNIEAVLAACRQTGAQAVHPGYGFLSENPRFADALEAGGIAFVGPTGEQMRGFGLKHSARAIAERSGVPMLPGSGLLADIAEAEREAMRIGFPVMLKSTAGGGGIGMQLCHNTIELRDRFASVQRLSQGNFGDDRVYLEKFVSRARHVEVQIFGDGHGGVVALGERDCSLQRRNQKVVEETPAPGLSDTTRRDLHAAAVSLGKAVRYRSAGTVEFIYDPVERKFYFLEVNTRLQVEHPVTESVFGIDLVEWMIRLAADDFVLPAQADLVPRGAAIEARIYAEDPSKSFLPSTGLLTEVRFPDTVRVDGWVATGTEVTPYYDPMLAKVIATGATRGDAIGKLASALDASAIWGIETNIAYVRAVLDLPAFRDGAMTTATLGAFAFTPRTIDVLVAGMQSSVQGWPGRIGYWDVGVPPSGPMDARNFRLANRAVGNDEGTAALELTLTGPTLRFNIAVVVALAGARMVADLDGAPVPWFTPVAVRAGQVLRLGAVEGAGSRAYLAVRHGIDAPLYLGSRATFALGRFGGHAGRALKDGDVLRLRADAAPFEPAPIPPAEQPTLSHTWALGVLYGPHGAPDFFTDADIATLFSADYDVHYNSARTGVRLIGPKPEWARQDGGEAGLHPSNIHDNAYAIGAIDFTGDMPIILGPDGPSLGGFVCPAVVTLHDLWKLGQLRPGDTVRFVRERLASITGFSITGDLPGGVLRRRDGVVPVCYRIAGDDNLLVEYGEMVLDIALRLRVQLLLEALRRAAPPGIVDLTPGIRSLQIHYDPGRLPLSKLLDLLEEIEDSLPSDDDIIVPSRIVRLPLSWDDEAAQLAMRKYQELVRPNAPWCPSNIEFIRRINGLDSIDAVRRIIFDASYLVLGLGDVYLGAPVATPIDPRHRLVTTKYNPARTWTPENAVGIGGAYLCVYGMEGPGGYQLFGRTIQMWNPWRSTAAFEPGKPWLLRFFDQIRLFPVSHEELEEARAAFPHGQYKVRIEPASFSLREYKAALQRDAAGIAAFKHTQQAAFEAERQRWVEQGLDLHVEDADVAPPVAEDELPPGAVAVTAPLQGNVWKVEVQSGQDIAAGEVLVILEAMKSEIRVTAPVAGRVLDVTCQPGRMVQDGQRLVVLAKADGAAAARLPSAVSP